MVSRGSYVVLAVTAAALLMGGCGGRMVQREELETVGRIAVASVVLPVMHDGSSEADRKVLQSTADHAALQVRSGLQGLRPWTVVDAKVIDKGKPAPFFGKVSDKALAALFSEESEEERSRLSGELAAELASWRKGFIGAAGLPIVPREALAPDEEQELKDPAVRTVMLHQAGELCRDLSVDAAAFVQVRYAVTHPRENAFIVSEDRTDGMLALSATLVMVDRSGKIIVDMGLRSIEVGSPSRDMLPLYRGAGKEAVAAENVDLADPKNKVARAFGQLVDESVSELMQELAKEVR
jgi:hypothetical protein